MKKFKEAVITVLSLIALVVGVMVLSSCDGCGSCPNDDDIFDVKNSVVKMDADFDCLGCVIKSEDSGRNETGCCGGCGSCGGCGGCGGCGSSSCFVGCNNSEVVTNDSSSLKDYEHVIGCNGCDGCGGCGGCSGCGGCFGCGGDDSSEKKKGGCFSCGGCYAVSVADYPEIDDDKYLHYPMLQGCYCS